MRPAAMARPSNCLALAVAAVLELDEIALPWTGGDWPAGWEALRADLAARGWRIAWVEWSGPMGATLAEMLEEADWSDPIEAALVWLIGVTHPSFVEADGTIGAHVLVLRGPEVVFDPGGDVALRPPLDELEVTGFFTLLPLDPAAFALRASATVAT